jgi:Ca-activated chloride channel homolog
MMPQNLTVAAPVAIPALMLLACALFVRRRRRAAAVLGGRHVDGGRSGADLHAIPWPRLTLVVLAAAALGIAAADPRWGAGDPAAATADRDVILVLDVSNSMRVEDVAPNRLELQRRAAERLVAARSRDRIGLVVFAGEASVLAPPTRDHPAIHMLLAAANPEIARQTGSAPAAGLRQALALLAGAPAGGRVIVLISDGEPVDEAVQRDAALEAAARAAGMGVVINTLGAGTPAGGPVPDIDFETGARRGWKRDPETGAIAISRLHAEVLREIAEATGGEYRELATAGAIEHVVRRIDDAIPREVRETGGEGAPRYAWFVLAALALMGAERVVDRRGRAGEGDIPA